MGIFICGQCDLIFDEFDKYKNHNTKKHNISAKITFVEIYHNGVTPTCECGCGEETFFISTKQGFRRFLSAHHNRVPDKNNFHKNPETKIKSAKTQSDNWKKGLYRRWWDEDTQETKDKIEGIKEKLRNNLERGRKISKSRKGIPMSDDAKRKSSETNKKRYDDNPELRTNLSQKRLKWFKDKNHKKQSKIEKQFENLLSDYGISFIGQYELDYKLFDFYIKEKNTLIEVDGDFFHCNPSTKHRYPKYQAQINTLKNDKVKNELVKKYNIPLYRFWEKDIKERPEWVKEKIKQILI